MATWPADWTTGEEISAARLTEWTDAIKSLGGSVNAADFFQWEFTNGSGASGDLSASGAGKVITLTECPPGLAVGSYVRIYDGTGTAEAVAITSTTCTLAGGAGGTITVTTAQTHTGSWKVGTATAGIQEATNALADFIGGVVSIPEGEHTLYAPVQIKNYVSYRGAGRAATVLKFGSSSMAAMFERHGTVGFDKCTWEDMGFYSPDSPNTNVVFFFSQLNFLAFRHLQADNVFRMWDMDRMHDVVIEDVMFHGVPANKIYDSVPGGSVYSKYIWMKNVRTYGTTSWLTTEAFLYGNYAASWYLDQVYVITQGGPDRAFFELEGHAEDIQVLNCGTIGTTFSIDWKDVYFSKIYNNAFDSNLDTTIKLDTAYQVTVVNNTLTGTDVPKQIHITRSMPSAATGQSVIANNVITGVIGGYAILVDEPHWNLVISCNNITALSRNSASYGIALLDTTTDRFAIVGNVFTSDAEVAISTISNANPAVVTTSASHPYETGGTVQLLGGTGSWDLDANFYSVIRLTPTTFSVTGLNSTAFGAFPGSMTVRSVAFNIRDDTPVTRFKTILGNVDDSDFSPASRISKILETNKQIRRRVDLPAAGSENVIEHVNGANSVAYFSLGYDSSANYSMQVVPSSTLNIGVGGVNSLQLTSSALNAGVNFFPKSVAFASLGTPGNGAVVYCSDGAVTSPTDNTCAGGGTGCLAVRINGVWRAFIAQN